MKSLLRQEIWKNTITTFMVAIVVLTSFPISASAVLLVDVKANGQDTLALATSTDNFVISLVSTDATACQITAPVLSGFTIGSTLTVNPGDVLYPIAGGSTTFTVTCMDATTATLSDSVTVSLPAPVAPVAPTIDVQANGSNGPVTLNAGDTYTYTWNSTNSTACEQTSPVTSGITLNGASATISSADAFYPSTTTPVTITVSCTNGTDTATDSVVISLASVVLPPPPGGGGGLPAPTIDVQANGSNGPVTLNAGDTYTYTWNSTNSTACEQTSPVTSGITLNGASATISSADAFYPSTTTPVTITVSCTNGTDTATDSVVISLASSTTTTTPPTVTPPSGGGGGRGGRGGRASTPVLPLQCPLIKDYMRIDFANDPIEVMKLQAFLKVFEGHDYVTINGVFDQATYQAVGTFQEKYMSEVLTPWGHTEATHYVYMLTQKKINEIYCQTVYQLSTDQLNEIDAFRALYQNIGNTPDLPIVGTVDGSGTDNGQPEVGIEDKGQIRQFAAAVLSFPETLRDKMQCLYEVVLILFVLYVLGSLLADVLYKKEIDKPYRRFGYKWFVIVVGLIVAVALAYLFGEFCLLLPLLIALLLSAVWIAVYPKHNSVKSRARRFHVALKNRLSIQKKTKAESEDLNLPGVIEIKDGDKLDF